MRSVLALLLLITVIVGLSSIPLDGLRSEVSSNPATAETAIPLSSCKLLNTPGANYVLEGNLTGREGFFDDLPVCILISADAVKLNLNGFSIVSDGNGIVVNASNDVITGPGTVSTLLGRTDIIIENGSQTTVRSLTLGLGLVGINATDSAGDLFENNNIASVANYGIFVNGGDGTRIIRNNITANPLISHPANLMGISLSSSPHSLVLDNTVERAGTGIFLDGLSGHSLIGWNDLSFNAWSGLVSLSSSTMILANTFDANAYGVQVAGSSSLVAFNQADNNILRGIALGNVCQGNQPSVESGNNNLIVLNEAKGTFPAFFWDGQGTGDKWILNSDSGQPIPLTPPTAPLEC